MTQTTFGNVPAILPQFYDRFLLDNLYPNLYLYQLGQKRALPRNFGRTINFTRYYKPVTPFAVTEGTPIGLSILSAARVTASVQGYAAAVGISDFVIMSGVSDIVKGAVFELSKAMALKIDNTIRQTISASGANLPARNSAGTASKSTATTSTTRAIDINRAAAKLRQADARTWPDGCLAGIVHPRVGFDLKSNLSTGNWIDVTKYAAASTADQIFRGELGKLYGVRLVESSQAKFLNGAVAGDPISTGASGFISQIVGPGAFGVVELDGNAASVFVKPPGSSGSADPVNQRGSVGIKTYFTAVVLEAARMVRVTSGGHTL